MLSRFGKFHVLKNATGSGLFGLFSDLLVAPSHLILVKLDFCVECCRQSSRDSPLVANYSQTHWSHPLTVKPELGIALLKAFKKVAIANGVGLSRQGVQKRLFCVPGTAHCKLVAGQDGHNRLDCFSPGSACYMCHVLLLCPNACSSQKYKNG